jgi:DNA polymerase IIIc chi subunit
MFKLALCLFYKGRNKKKMKLLCEILKKNLLSPRRKLVAASSQAKTQSSIALLALVNTE